MCSNRKTMMSHDLRKWRYEEDIHFLKSLVGSEIEFIENYGKRQRVVGTLNQCDDNSYNLSDTKINGKYFGCYVLNDYEVYKWRLFTYIPADNPSKSRPQNRPRSRRSEDNSKYLIPNQFEEPEEGDPDQELLRRCVEVPYDSEDVEAVDLKEDEEPVHINVQPLSLKASNEVIFVDEINENFNLIVDKIRKCHSVGFALFGEEISRDGLIELMSFATPEAIYVFDANNNDIITRLSPLLESKEVQKVMFALRHSSDALHHLFRIDLNNAVDVRVWDYCLQKKNFIAQQMSVKPVLRSLEAILWRYLRVKVPNMYRNLDFKQFSVKIENFIRVKTIFLRELFYLINYKLLEDVYQMNSRCLRSLRSAEGLEYIAIKADEMELQIIDNPILESEETERKIISCSSNKPINGFKGKEIIVDSNDEIIIESDEEIDEIVVRLTPK